MRVALAAVALPEGQVAARAANARLVALEAVRAAVNARPAAAILAVPADRVVAPPAVPIPAVQAAVVRPAADRVRRPGLNPNRRWVRTVPAPAARPVSGRRALPDGAIRRAIAIGAGASA